MRLTGASDEIIILGGGLAGLSAAYALSKAHDRVLVLEQDTVVGGLSKTIESRGFRFDLGGHRFYTRNRRVEHFLRDLMGEELLEVSRSSKVYMRGKYFDYPLKPSNAILGLGAPTTLKILYDYACEVSKNAFRSTDKASLEDWVVSKFGHTLFDIYFKEYSEKVWGVGCADISSEWVAQRIQNLSLGAAIKNAFFKFSGRDLPTLADNFLYPAFGIGRISEKLQSAVQENGRVLTGTRIERVCHSKFQVRWLITENEEDREAVLGQEFISSVPLTALVGMLDPKPPEEVLAAANGLRYRDLVVVAVMLDRERVTDQSWIYVPEQRVGLGRLHEPKNWSPAMAPPGKTHLVAEYFCFEGSPVWGTDDGDLVQRTVDDIEKLGLVKSGEVIGGAVVRVPRAYPLLEVGYRKHYDVIWNYLNRFENLHVLGRGGSFRYLNMDHVIGAGLNLAENVLKRKFHPSAGVDAGHLSIAGDVR